VPHRQPAHHSCIQSFAVTWSSPSTSANFSPKFPLPPPVCFLIHSNRRLWISLPHFIQRFVQLKNFFQQFPAEAVCFFSPSLRSPSIANKYSTRATGSATRDRHHSIPNFASTNARARLAGIHKIIGCSFQLNCRNFASNAPISIHNFRGKLKWKSNPQKNSSLESERYRKVLSPQTKMAGETDASHSQIQNSGNHA